MRGRYSTTRAAASSALWGLLTPWTSGGRWGCLAPRSGARWSVAGSRSSDLGSASHIGHPRRVKSAVLVSPQCTLGWLSRLLAGARTRDAPISHQGPVGGCGAAMRPGQTLAAHVALSSVPTRPPSIRGSWPTCCRRCTTCCAAARRYEARVCGGAADGAERFTLAGVGGQSGGGQRRWQHGRGGSLAAAALTAAALTQPPPWRVQSPDGEHHPARRRRRASPATLTTLGP